MKTEKQPRTDTEFLSTLERGLSVLRSFGRTSPQMTLSEVAETTQLSPAVARRCLLTLVKLGYVTKHKKQFLLRPDVMHFASAYLESMSLSETVRPHLQSVRDATGDSSSFSVLAGQDVLYLVHISTNRMVRLAVGVGTRFPAYATSLGRAILGFETPQVQAAYGEACRFEPLTEHTVKSRAEFRQILSEVRRAGYAASENELDYGLVSLAVPIRDASGRASSAINCSTSTSRADKAEMIRSRLPVLLNAARHIESELRRQPYLIHSVHPD